MLRYTDYLSATTCGARTLSALSGPAKLISARRSHDDTLTGNSQIGKLNKWHASVRRPAIKLPFFTGPLPDPGPSDLPSTSRSHLHRPALSSPRSRRPWETRLSAETTEDYRWSQHSPIIMIHRTDVP
jgi:hypothetical protein